MTTARDPRVLSAEEYTHILDPERYAEAVKRVREERDIGLALFAHADTSAALIKELQAANLALTERIEALEGENARAQALGEVADYISMYGGMSGGPESWADLSEAIRNDAFGATDEQRKIMHHVLTGGGL